MGKIEDYFNYHQQELLQRFERIRKTHSNPTVKGVGNEEIIAEFLKEHLPETFPVTRVEIIDSYGHISNEVDVSVCNKDQPFMPQSSSIVIAEGVDFVVQVKAQMTIEEAKRCITNCISVKKLVRKHHKGDLVAQSIPNSHPYFVDRIPYFVFAFSSRVQLHRLLEVLGKEFKELDYKYQIDAIFILNTGCIVNGRDGTTSPWHRRATGEPISGLFSLETGDKTLLEFMRYIYLVVPKFTRMKSPLTHYFPEDPPYQGKIFTP